MESIVKNWTFIRFVKLAIGLGFMVSFPKHEEYFLLFGGIYFFVMALFNIGCGGGKQCQV